LPIEIIPDVPDVKKKKKGHGDVKEVKKPPKVTVDPKLGGEINVIVETKCPHCNHHIKEERTFLTKEISRKELWCPTCKRVSRYSVQITMALRIGSLSTGSDKD